ncbi:MAG: site-2 protease family protein [Kofleriaceae bacterium]|nr:site-2 protease family protein [Kofleriaceae bacterium]
MSELLRPRLGARALTVHVALFVATCVTTYLAQDAIFAATLMTILLCHEMGHFVAARRRGVDVTLPYFIPLPPQISLGTMGAVIKMRSAIDDRDALFDVGASGPIAGLVVAVPLLVIGLTLSHVGPIPPDSVLEGNSIFYLTVKLIVFGHVLPSGSTDVQLHSMAFAAWVGILVTMINLIPIGQLDGGHVVRAWLGDRHERMSAVLHKLLVVMAVVVGAAMTALARARGHGWADALQWSAFGATPWLTWALMLALLRRAGDGHYHPPVGGGDLSPGRQRLAIGVVCVFLLIFTPVPMVPAM